jgi:hypothetical protein
MTQPQNPWNNQHPVIAESLTPEHVKLFEEAKDLVREQRFTQALPILQVLYKWYPLNEEVKTVLDYSQANIKNYRPEPWASNSVLQKPVQQPRKMSNRAIGFLALIIIVIFFLFQGSTSKSTSPSPISPVNAPAATSAPVDSDYRYSLYVTGNSKFSGTCLVYTSSGSSSSKDASGLTPATFYYTGNLISCTLQKAGESGSLHVTLSRGGSQLAVGDTSNEYGVVSVAGR